MAYEKKSSDDTSRTEVEEEPSELDAIARDPFDSDDEDADADLEKTPGIRTSGRKDISVMSQSERRREFPSVARPTKRKLAPKPPRRARGNMARQQA